jgi:hypothetical protein
MFDARHSSKDIKILEPNGYMEKEEELGTVSVMLMQSLIVKIIGDVTGKEYIFNGGGSIVEVDKQDIGIINKYNVSTISCCGSYSSPYFKFI